MQYGNSGAFLQRRYGLSYFFSTLFFPPRTRRHVFALYGMVRVADNLVDAELPAEVRKDQLLHYRSELESALQKSSLQAPLTVIDFANLVRECQLSKEYINAFFVAMEQDTDTLFVYKTYEQLENYMYGSAVAIGLLMSQIIGHAEGALPYAQKLAEAMQLTNFLRDVKEDYQKYGRIYIPEEDMTRFGLSRIEFTRGDSNEGFRKLIAFEVARARALYEEGEKGIPLLHKEGRRPVLLASRLYQGILHNIEKGDFRPWSISAKTSFVQKFSILIKTLWIKV